MRAFFHNRRSLPRLAARVLVVVAAIVLTATLAAALQVRHVRITGTHRFPAHDVETVLQTALGTPTIAARASELRARVCALPWVADASVRISLDGVVSCTVVERTPVALGVDGARRELLDREGRILAPAEDGSALLELDGFAAHPEERAALLAVAGDLQRFWGSTLQRVVLLGPRGVALHFADTPFPVLTDPNDPHALVPARQVLHAWRAAGEPMPLRLDARVVGRVALAPQPSNGGPG
jgi:cell division septal protein FtsQ